MANNKKSSQTTKKTAVRGNVKNNNRTYKVNNSSKNNIAKKKSVTIYDSKNSKGRSNNTRNTAKSYSKGGFKVTPKLVIFGVCILALILSYIFLGPIITIILLVGIGSIFAVARLLDKTKSKSKKRKIINTILIVFLSLCIVGALTVSAFLVYVVQTAPKFDISKLDKKEATVFYDKDGKEITKLGAELREKISYDELPEVFVDALVSIEDSRFFQHNGFDAPRFFKAAIGQIAGNDSGGGSTLSMQVIKNSFTSTESSGIKGLIRKFTDIYLSVFKLEKNYTKEEIIEFYVNNHFLSSGAYGVEQASQVYFGKSASEMNLAEAAMIAGMFQAPSSYDPYNYPAKTYNRRYVVLDQMVKHGYITQAEADAANAVPIDSMLIGKNKKTLAYQGYIDTVIQELIDKRGINPSTTPLLIYTNMDRNKQQAVDDIMNGKSNAYTWLDDVVQSGVAVTDVNTGKLIAVGAGRNKTTQLSYNYATMTKNTKRQIGSTAKPIFDYGPGMEFNNWSTYTQFNDSAYTYSNGVAINNSDRKYMGQISLRTALSQSRNIPALKAFQSVSNKKIIEFATSLGITPEIENGRIHEAHAVGAFNGASPLDMAVAYQAFANGGYYIEPLTVNKIVYRDNGDTVTYEPEKKQVMSDSTAFMITDALETAVTSGLSNGAKVNNVNVAAKTGTSSYDDATKKARKLPSDAVNDSWIVGYDPDITISMWYGYPKIDSKYCNRELQGVIQRGKLYRALGNALFTKDNQQFKVPSSVVKVGVEKGSNPALLPSANTPADQITYEYFKKGTEPTEVSTKYDKLTTVSNLKVTYDSNTSKVNISWSKLNAPSANESYGAFGYNVYYNDALLGFTTDNSYSISSTANVSGTYKVITVFEKFTSNQSNPATYTFTYSGGGSGGGTTPTPTTTPKSCSLQLVGSSTYQLKQNQTYEDSEPAVKLIVNGSQVDVDLSRYITTTLRYKSGNATTINGQVTIVPSTYNDGKVPIGNYTITYTVNYNGVTCKKDRIVWYES